MVPANHPVIDRCDPAHAGRQQATLPRVLLAIALSLLLLDPLFADDRGTARVAYVIDGDTVILKSGERVRLLGINTPEIAHKNTKGEPLGEQARQALIRLIDKKTVTLKLGVESRDRYGRLLAHLISGSGKSIGAALLEQGLAAVVAIPPNIDHLPEFRRAEDLARRARRGVWADPYFEPRSADLLRAGDQGFRRVVGVVSRVASTNKRVYLQLTPQFSIAILRPHWERYWQGQPEQYLKKRITVRGWLVSSPRRWRINIGHPAMIRVNTNE